MRSTLRSIVSVLLAVTAVTAEAVPFPGPDAYGYHGSEITYNLRDVSATGTAVTFGNSDDATAVASIGFDFSFYGNTYSSLEIGTNGFVTFTQSGNSYCCSGSPIVTAGGLNNFIAGWWQDNNLTSDDGIRIQVLGAPGSREFVIGFYNVEDLDRNVPERFEIILHEGTNDIELQYDIISYDEIDNKVMGIENFNGTDGIQLAYYSERDPNLANGEVLFNDKGYCFSSGGSNCGTVNVPEPNILALLGLGILGLGVSRLRKH